jgi:hypothetical protein
VTAVAGLRSIGADERQALAEVVDSRPRGGQVRSELMNIDPAGLQGAVVVTNICGRDSQTKPPPHLSPRQECTIHAHTPIPRRRTNFSRTCSDFRLQARLTGAQRGQGRTACPLRARQDGKSR